MTEHKRICARIDLDALDYNIDRYKEKLPAETKVCAVIKADAYGHGAVPIARHLSGRPDIWGFAVATIEEAEELREAGITDDILLLGYIFPDAYARSIHNDLRICIGDLSSALLLSNEAGAMGRTAKVHIKIDTGMSRIGFPVTEEGIRDLKEIALLPNLELEGIFTHFAKADEEDYSFSVGQAERFDGFVERLEEEGITFRYRHLCNSAGGIRIPSAGYSFARYGISLYGMMPSPEVSTEEISLRPVLSLITHVSFVKTVPEGTPVSYGGTYVTPKEERLATLPIGYGDGYPRTLSNKGTVLIGGKRAPIRGRVCMDQIVVDVTGIPDVSVGSEVVLVGSQGDDRITVEELCELSGRFHYEFTCVLTGRVPRVYFRNGEHL